MSATPSLPEQSMLRAQEALTGARLPDSGPAEVSDELRVEDTIIDIPDDLDDPERSAVVHDEADDVSSHLDSATEFDLREQTIVVPEDEDERAAD